MSDTEEKCDFCPKVRDGKWALLFGTPIQLEYGIEVVQKYHVCPDCYKRTLKYLGGA